MSATIFLVLGGLLAFGFLILVWRRRRQMPVLLRAILMMAAAAIVIYVAWTLVLVFNAAPAIPR